jgi:outer membrane protein OmpA-like peptidoglycan-associated protein
MKVSPKVFALLALALITGGTTGARAEEQPGFPVQVEIEARQIHATHSLRDLHCGHATETGVAESIAPALLFDTASDKLTPAAKTSIKKVAALLKTPAYQNRHVLVSGYTDNKGKVAANQRLSYHRAVMVVKELVKNGVPASQLTAQGFGKENPVATNATRAGRALNRRVTFTVVTTDDEK